MGYFSWKTGDTKESIMNVDTDEHNPNGVYLLKPDGSKIHELKYEGYGDFGDVNAYVQLARQNEKILGINIATDDEAFDIGLSLDTGDVYIEQKTGLVWHVLHSDSSSFIEGKVFKGKGDELIDELGMSANEAMEAGVLKPISIKNYLKERGIKLLPLKFSFNPNATYDTVGVSEICERQGFF